MRRRLLFVAAFAAFYTVATAVAAVAALGAAMSGFEPGQPEASPAAIWFYGSLADALMLPLVPWLAPRGAPGLWGYVIIFGNGVIWGTVLVVFWSIVRRWRVAGRVASASAA